MGLARTAGAWVGALLLLAPALSLGKMPTQRPERLVSVDASTPVAIPKTGYLHMGTSRSSDGQTLAINSRYLTLDGRPWLPVMAEFHYWRVPTAEWDEELTKVKASGVDIVSTYVYWTYHEREAGRFDWQGRHDLRHFVQLCGQHGLKVILRLGPWIHAETRFGGLPDWLVALARTRANDPVYLQYIARYFDQIGVQARGLLWKDGGPIIGIQLENEYHLTGPEQGRAHIAALKRLAVAAGFDVPLYTVTAWDNAVYQQGEVTPMYGGYPGLPWDPSTSRLPPNEVYAFRFRTRVTGDTSAASLAAQTAGDATRDAGDTPFLAAEFGGGLPAMYRRRLIASADDIASMLVVQIGSGVNLYGYYMFHGGVNPAGGPWVETTASGGYNDVPRRDYDFQAPIGAFGEERASLGKLRPMHYFLQSFGERLAPMAVRRPKRLPSGSRDLETPRWSVRSLGDSGFLFFNNHVRGYAMLRQRHVRFRVRFPDRTLKFPSTPIDIPAGAYFVWRLDMNLDGALLRYATVQPVTRLATDGDPVYVFRAVDGIPVELSFDAGTVSRVEPDASGGRVAQPSGGALLVTDVRPGTDAMLTVHTRRGTAVRLLILTEAQAEGLWRVKLGGAERLLLTGSQVIPTDGAITLRSEGDPHFSFGLFPAVLRSPVANRPLRQAVNDGVFETFTAEDPARSIPVSIRPLRAATAVPPVRIGGDARAAMEPVPETFGDSAAWSIRVAQDAGEAMLRIDYRGDVAQLFAGTDLIDDNFYDGLTWDVGLERFAHRLAQPLTLTVLPLRSDAPIYIQSPYRPWITPGAQLAEVLSVQAVPEYRLRIGPEVHAASPASSAAVLAAIRSLSR